MKRFISSFVITALISSSVTAYADEPPTPPATITPLSKGQPAPYLGVLFSPEAVAQVVAEKDAAERRLLLAIQHQVDLDAVQLKFEKDTLTTTCNADKEILQAQVDDGKRQVDILNDQLKKQTGGPGAPVWIGLGAVGGVVLTVITVFAVSQATK